MAFSLRSSIAKRRSHLNAALSDFNFTFGGGFSEKKKSWSKDRGEANSIPSFLHAFVCNYGVWSVL
ncbi:hypothetical protein DA098_12235 [Vibrio parahaemolyticus]|nr:hypothetical protein DA098_12235 [Vibrio parahaemolyticus]TMX73052.1 hypothetical protein DA094_24780 [Vibrio parahaemolyticus]